MNSRQVANRLREGLGVFLVDALLSIQDAVRKGDDQVMHEIRQTFGAVQGGRVIRLFQKHDLRKLVSN